MTKEIDRCRWALQTAAAGKTVALVCSGDAGVYGMAAPLLQLVPPESPKVRAARRRRNVRRVGLALDLLASLAVVAVTVTAMVQFVRLA